MRSFPFSNLYPAITLALLMLFVPGREALAGDLDAASDGEHLWLVIEDPEPEDKDEPGLIVYHLSAASERGQLAEFDRLPGELMPRGIAAGDGQLLMVMADRRIEVVRPVWSKLQRKWVGTRKSLPALPDGCALMSITLGNRGPWALVRVESEQTLDKLDDAARARVQKQSDPGALNRALGLPEGYELNPTDTPGNNTPSDNPEAGPGPDDVTGGDAEGEAGTPIDPPAARAAGTDEAAAGDTQPDEQAQADQPPAPRTPAYRLIHLSGGKWGAQAVPEGLAAPRRAVLLFPDGDDRPSIIAERSRAGAATAELTRYRPVPPADGAGDGPGWAEHRIELSPPVFGQWSAALVNKQVVLSTERMRSDQMVSVRSSLLRVAGATRIGTIDLPTNGRSNWAAVPWRGGIALIGRPGPKLEQGESDTDPIEPVAGLIAMGLGGQPIVDSDSDNGVVVLYEAKPSRIEDNADRLIQIGAFITAMVMMMLFFRQAPRGDQLDLKEGVVLASFGRRFVAGLIDLAPGFWLAGVVYEITINETILFWPGNGVEKVLPAMRPGFLVIVVTVAHTTLFEFITARSIGKWFTGLYVADLTGKPAPPGASLARALSRVFDLFAPLMLMLMVISPARQRLGDILAKTIVVMHEPELREENEQDDDPGY